MSTDTDMFPPTLPVVATVRMHEGGPQWLEQLPSLVTELRDRWSLRLDPPIHGGSCSWVAPAWLPDGESAVLKVTWPHREAAGEAEGLRRWDGRGAVRVLREDPAQYAVLIERCDPGQKLGDAGYLGAREQLLVGARLLHELWSAETPQPGDTGLERVADLTADWADTAAERMERLRPDFDPGLVATGVRLLRELPGGAAREVIVHGDFNPGNVLSAARRPWLAIDAKPMIGDPGYDPWPLLAQIDDPFNHAEPRRVLAERFALVSDVLGEDVWRMAAWAFAREVESALWAVDHADSPIAHGSIGKAYVFAELAGL